MTDVLNDKRQALIDRIAAQRHNCRAITQELQQPLHAADKGLTLFHYVAQRPLILVGALAVVIVAKPRRVVTALRTGFKAWQLWQTFSPLLFTKKDAN